MELDLYQIDAFAEKPFEGNPAAVCPLDYWLPDTVMQSIAEENNLSETAFFVPKDKGHHIRWFSPVREVDLCGHATLASAYVLFNFLGFSGDHIEFDSRSGVLTVAREKEWLVMNFPAQPPKVCELPGEMIKAFGKKPAECLRSADYLAVFDSEKEILELRPDFAELAKLDLRGVIVTAPSDSYDFVARFFAPKYGINEDPVTGSAYTQLVPYWSGRLEMERFRARQVSKRGGDLISELKGDRVNIYGKAVTFLKGKIQIGL